MRSRSEGAEKKKELSSDDIGVLLFFSAVILGTFFRLVPPLAAEFPINDGALFYKMIETVQDNGFALPYYVEFNKLQIPFAYPPLAFYLAGAIGKWFHIPLFQIELWMPALVLILTLPFVYLLARELLASTLKAGIAIFLYALLPRAITWMIMGGGVTRSLGNIFLIIASLQIYLMFINGKPKNILLAILFSSLVCLTHPEATIHTILFALLAWYIFGQNKSGLRNGIIVGVGTLIITSPWWVTILTRFGFDPFLSAGQTGFNNFFSIFAIFTDFSEEPFITIINVMAVLGLFIQIAKKQCLLPLWYVLPFIIEPRNAPNVSIIPMTMLAVIGLTEMILPRIRNFEASVLYPINPAPKGYTVKLFLVFLLVNLMIGMISFESKLMDYQVTPEDQETFRWVRENTGTEETFVIIGASSQFIDYFNEWFPMLAERRNHTTIQGYEWLAGNSFRSQSTLIKNIEECTIGKTPILCLEEYAEESKLTFDYILVHKGGTKDGFMVVNMITALFTNDNYELAFNSPTTSIFKRKE